MEQVDNFIEKIIPVLQKGVEGNENMLTIDVPVSKEDDTLWDTDSVEEDIEQ